jgi:hypothetical protein
MKYHVYLGNIGEAVRAKDSKTQEVFTLKNQEMIRKDDSQSKISHEEEKDEH